MGVDLQSMFTFSTKARGFVLAASLLASADPRSSVTEIISGVISVPSLITAITPARTLTVSMFVCGHTEHTETVGIKISFERIIYSLQ